MREVILQVKECHASGETGLVVAGLHVEDQMVVASGSAAGVLIAHDLIEHLHGVGEIGGAAEELMAMGAAWYCRGRHGDITRGPNAGYHPSEHHIASDVGNQCFEAWVRQDRCWDRTIGPEAPNDIDAALTYIFEEACKNILAEDHNYGPGDIFRFLLGARRFMRHGYRVMDERYHDTPLECNNTFWAIAEAVDRVMAGGDLWNGVTYTLQYGEGDAVCEPVMDHEY